MARPLVLLHGIATSSARTWGETGWLDLLADADIEPVLIDLPGHGNAPKPQTSDEVGDLVAYIVERLPAEPCEAMGFSLGARLLLSVAAVHPDRFTRICVAGVGNNLFERDAARGKAIASAIAGELDPEDPEARHFHALADSPDVDRASVQALMAAPHPPLNAELLANVACPVLVVLGDQDFAGPADPLVEALPNATFKALRGVDHFATPKSFAFIDAGLEFFEAFPA